MSQPIEPNPSNDGARRNTVAVTLLLPVASVLSLLLGLGLGGAIGWLAKPAPAPEPTVYDPADIAFQAACAPMVAESTTRIEELNLQIGDLRGQVSEKAARVQELEAKAAAATGAAKKASTAELSKAREELAQLKLQVASLTTEKEQLVASLTQTRQQLEVAEVAVAQTRAAWEEQVAATRVARDDAANNKYVRFLGESQLAICEKGGRKKMGDCRGAVQARLQQPAVRDQFYQCVRSGQAIPVVREATGGSGLPSYSAWLGSDKIMKGWYVTMCDPSLPEANLADSRPPDYTPMAALSSAAAYFSSVVPSAVAAPTAAVMPSSFSPSAPATAQPDLDEELGGLDMPEAAPKAASNADLLDISAIIGEDDPAAAPAAPAKKDEAPPPARNEALDDDLSDLPEDL